MMTNSIIISFILPVFNEENFLKEVLIAINELSHWDILFEIVVVDNGSVDTTVDLAKSLSALTFIQPELTIGGLRNYGVTKSSGKILVFLDGDMRLTEAWRENIRMVVESMDANEKLITGSFAGIPKDPTWIERAWFSKIQDKKKVNYINSGHLIVSREFFDSLGGFDEVLVTGEDYDFCQRALEQNGTLFNDLKLKVIHLGYPKNIGQFFRRERWHGVSDVASFRQVIKSKVACVSLSLVLLGVCAIILSLLLNPIIFLLYCFLFFIVCFFAAYQRCQNVSLDLLLCTFLYSVYFLARSMSMFSFPRITGAFFAKSN